MTAETGCSSSFGRGRVCVCVCAQACGRFKVSAFRCFLHVPQMRLNCSTSCSVCVSFEATPTISPPSIKDALVAKSSSSPLCVTQSTERFPSGSLSMRLLTVLKTPNWLSESKKLVTSSRSRSFGFSTSAAASASLCFWPPESVLIEFSL
mmetsp:Transcript_14514/g.28063  ORF Transcript_14514/g.28063 Transcript_14514/m.28063 type:complete len:150 (-) Transcript_14514:330-779(-)